MILLIDNYDSFVHNLARYFNRLGQTTRVVRNDQLCADDLNGMRPDAIVISPGPCAPDDSGCSIEVVQKHHRSIPILGVCLGHQVIAQAFGGNIVRALEPVHGRPWNVYHDGASLFDGLPSPLVAGRYHSLVVEEKTLPRCLEVTAQTAEGVVMALHHRDLPVVGVQFHPESILTQHGYSLLTAFLRLSGLSAPEHLPSMSQEQAVAAAQDVPVGPVTF